MAEGGRSKIQSHRDLLIWQRSMKLAESVYRTTSAFPKHEQYGMTAQLTRAAVSVPANIAEGFARGSRRDYSRFLAIARGSLLEVDTMPRLAPRLGYGAEATVTPMLAEVDEISRMISAIRRKLDAKPVS